MSWYQKGKTNVDFTEARDSEWQWHQLGHMQVCTLLQADNHASTPPLSFLQAGCPSCRPTNSVKALKALPSHTRWAKTNLDFTEQHKTISLTLQTPVTCTHRCSLLSHTLWAKTNLGPDLQNIVRFIARLS